MLVLHQGVLSRFDCTQRMGIVLVGAILAQMLLLAQAGFSHSAATNPVETLDRSPFVTRRRLIVSGIWSLIVLFVATLCMATRTETQLWLDTNIVGETSCIGPFPQEYELDRSQIRIDLKSESLFLTGNNSGSDYYLAISQPGKPRRLFIDLKGREDAPELVSFAPLLMREYADGLRGTIQR